jgi:DNA/RNA-binding domain of Phe-tRNA-synthetase-like protein
MLTVQIDPSITSVIPTFKLGLISYHSIVISDSPQMLKGRLQFFQETLQMELDEKELTESHGVKEWREAFKTLKIDPSKYRPSHEALLRRIKKGNFLPSLQSAVDLNTFFSLQYQVPFGIYDRTKLKGDLSVKLGQEGDGYEGVNGRYNDMKGKLITTDQLGPFGSPIVDSKRTSVAELTTSAIQLIYLKPSMEVAEAEQLVQAVASMFTQIHGGEVLQESVINSRNS